MVCPFCYIGKRRFEQALAQFPQNDKIQVEWKSYQLMPEVKTQPGRNMLEFFSEIKGVSLERAEVMHHQVTEMARQSGLDYHFEKTIPANTFTAHRFIHHAKAHGKQDEAEEILFRSYFTEGKNIDDLGVLLDLGKEIGLDTEPLKATLTGDTYTEDVRFDIYEAQQIGVSGVPFFVLDRKYAISGAQDVNTFQQTIERAFNEWQKNNAETKLDTIEGASCTPDGECD